MGTDRDDDVAQLRRTVRLMAEATRDVITALHEQMHEESLDNRDYTLSLALARAEGRLDAVLSGLGVGAPGGAGEGGGRQWVGLFVTSRG